jgi:ABC-2 type transport system ATP-binding protein
MPDAIIQIRDLHYRYAQRIAVAGVTLDIFPREAFAFLGPNGSGKTTLFRVLSTLVRPQEGRVTMMGLDLPERSEDVRRGIGVVFQSPSLDKQLTAYENLLHHGHLYGLRGRALRQRISALLARARLGERAGERVGSFSGGMRRRVELAKALLTAPRILLLDEPSTGLDPVARQELWHDLDDVRNREGVTILMTTHLMDEADRCDRVAVMNQGSLVACDTPAALKEQIGGDVITIATHDVDRVRALLRDRLGIEADSVALASSQVRFERPRGHEFIPRLIEALPGLVDSVSVGKPTLEDVIVHLTGRALGEETAADPRPARAHA